MKESKGHSTSYDVIDLGYNYRMDDIRASIGIVQLDKLEKDLSKRAEIRAMYIDSIGNNDNLIIPFKDNKNYSSNYIFPIVLKNSNRENRDEVRNKLAEAGIQTSVHYPAVHRFSIYKDNYTDLPNTDYVSDNLITLPLYSSLNEQQVKFIAATLKEILKTVDKVIN